MKNDNKVFEIDEGFGGQRVSVSSIDSEDCGGGGFVSMFFTDQDASVSVDFDVWDRIVAAVAKRREV